MSQVPTTERLAKAMEERLPHRPANDLVWREMIARARKGYYDDYKSPLATPCIQLVTDLRQQGEHDLATRAVNGDFDATKAESDAWAASPDGQAAFPEIIRPQRSTTP